MATNVREVAPTARQACRLVLPAPDDDAIFCTMAPRSRTQPNVRPSTEDEADIRKALAELDRGEAVELTADELRHWAETGGWPERLD